MSKYSMEDLDRLLSTIGASTDRKYNRYWGEIILGLKYRFISKVGSNGYWYTWSIQKTGKPVIHETLPEWFRQGLF